MNLRSVIGILLLINLVSACNRKPQGASGDQSAVGDDFQITIEGNPPTFIPGQAYNVTLACAINFKFISFTLVAETEPDSRPRYDLTGHFEIIDPAETRFSTQCENMLESSNTKMKNRIDVTWVAPTNPNSTCVLLKAAVLQHRNVWFMDDGFLTKRICAEEIDDVNSQTPLVNPCCACDEAKYELVLERRWTRNTHAKDFPKEDWRTKFSEVVGASHSFGYRFWAYGSQASLGLKELGEHGATKTLENEIKEHSGSGNIRTIIKAPGIAFRKNIISTTLATVRVDPRHHLVSFVTKIIPSPDWILGVAGLELCLANCTWIERKLLNLFPWDIGTDAGPSYMSPDQQQVPADVVRRITSTFPSDYRSPFYDDAGAPMKPMATLYITRKKLYERECEPDGNVPYECATHPWIDWSDCSTKCGPGTQYRTRAYKDPSLAARYNCEIVLRQTQRCVGTKCGLQEENDIEQPQSAECALTSWSDWSPCSKSCGRGFTKRTRDYRNPYARQSCQAALQVELEQTEKCTGNACGGAISNGYGQFDQYQPEPGLMEENIFEQPFYPTQQEGDRFNERWDAKSRLPTDITKFGDANRIEYGTNEQPELNYPNNNPNYPETNYPETNYPNRNTNVNIDENSLARDNLPNSDFNENESNGYTFNNQRWVSSNQNLPLDIDSKNLYSNGFTSFSHNKENQYSDMRGNQFQYNQQYEPRTTERTTSRFKNVPKKGRYSNSQTDYNQPIEIVGNVEMGEVFDDYGHKSLMAAGTRPDEYTVVQEYCNHKPYVVLKRCPGKKRISNFWFFDIEDRECKIFTTDNCDENKNKFHTLEGCEGTCLQPILNLEMQRMQQQTDGRENNESRQFGEPLSQTRPKKMNNQFQERINHRQRNNIFGRAQTF